MLTNVTQQRIASLINQKAVLTGHDLSNITIHTLIENGVAVLLASKIAETNSSLPTFELSKRLTAFSKQLQIIHTLQRNAFHEVFLALKKKGIDFIVLKGWALSHTVYTTPYSRPKTDIDILITSPSKAEVKQILLELGYTNPRGWEPKEIIDQFSMRKEIVNGVYANVDVHLQLTNDRAIQPLFPWNELVLNTQFESSIEAKVLNKPIALLHAIIHMLHHACHGDFIKLIWFYDIKLLVESITDSEEKILVGNVSENNLGKIVKFALIETSYLFPSKKLSELIDKIPSSNDITKFEYLTQSPSKFKVMVRNFYKTKGMRKKLKLLQETFFPPKEEIYIKYGNDSKYPVFILYFIRIFSGITRIILRKK
ncbi:nucleotidyltransferase family protein [Aestuariibacter sp. A3R04]|uniref:nucleotidyltransferase family protein n=1 Tax=Aestuariibacter sp. A3R04 TaxID=2841571 RepID=UPI001C088658|nr:nucleotidyltransferase family protein [Aestuariibacter sp. A3R04]MBU3023746.1 nucleotidyltransferase family protein [Aestuariibacter sp. A3R04]